MLNDAVVQIRLDLWVEVEKQNVAGEKANRVQSLQAGSQWRDILKENYPEENVYTWVQTILISNCGVLIKPELKIDHWCSCKFNVRLSKKSLFIK